MPYQNLFYALIVAVVLFYIALLYLGIRHANNRRNRS